MKNQNKTKIWVVSFVNAKVGELDHIKMEGRIRRIRKEVVRCVQDVVGKNKFLVQFEDVHKK